MQVKDLATGKVYTESYDKLVLAPGANAVVPRIPGIEEASLFTVKTVDDAARLHGILQQQSARRVSVIGGGFIGIEVAVNLREAGYEVAVIEAMPQILRTYDYDMVQILHKEMQDHGVELVLGDSVVAFHGSGRGTQVGPRRPRGRGGHGGGRPSRHRAGRPGRACRQPAGRPAGGRQLPDQRPRHLRRRRCGGGVQRHHPQAP